MFVYVFVTAAARSVFVYVFVNSTLSVCTCLRTARSVFVRVCDHHSVVKAHIGSSCVRQ